MFNNNVNVYNDEIEYYCDLKINMLNREIHTITKRGGLTEEEDQRLTEIDTELDYWYELQDEINYCDDIDE
jgi:hypothetical protein